MITYRQSCIYSMFLVSAGTLVFEVVLTRLFALAFWHHFAALLIALALTGFGAAGSLLAVTVPRLKNGSSAALTWTALAAGLAMMWAYPAVLAVGLEPLALAWAVKPWFELGLVCLILIVPFLLAAAHIGLILAWSENVSRDYALNLAGSGIGCLAAAVTLAHLPPHQALYPAFILVIFGALCQVLMAEPRTRSAAMIVTAAAVVSVFAFPPRPHFEPFKDRSAALAARGARLEFQETGLRGVAEIIGGPAFHFMPGLSLSCKANLPPQKGLFLDGDLIGPITMTGSEEIWPAMSGCLLVGFSYNLIKPDRALIIEPEGGLNLLTALTAGAGEITGLVHNPQIVKLMTGPLADFSGDIYRRPGVSIVRTDPGLYLAGTEEKFDLIVLGQGTRWESGSESGLGVSRLLTVEGLTSMLSRLKPGGILSLAGPLMTPPRASIRLLATAERSLRESGREPKARLAMIRDWNTVMVLIKPSGFDRAEIDLTVEAAEARGFDLPYLAGKDVTGLRTHHKLPDESLAQAAEAVLAGDSARFLKSCYFDLEPATRDRPYFFNFFRLKTLRFILKSKDSHLLPVTEWGLLFTWGGFLAAVILAGLGIFAPLIGRRPGPGGLVFFGLIGLGYMLAEITLLSEAIYRLGHPALAVPMVVGIFLVASGLGSLLWGRRYPLIFTLTSAVVLPAALLGLRYLPGGSFGAGLALVPAALLMGAPFAGGLTHLAGTRSEARAWAFGVNGFFSVAGSLAATLICLGAGHLAAILCAGGCYLMAGLTVVRGRSS